MAKRVMSSAIQELYDGLQSIVNEIASSHGAAGTPRVELTRPTEEAFGDYATNVALMLAPVVGSNPRVIGSLVAEQVRNLPGVASAEVAGPGFVNITMTDEWFSTTLASVMVAGSAFGRDTAPQPERIILEFVSANPVGPFVAATARHAAYGDSLTRLLRFVGHDVATEYYVNDTGRQIELFGESIHAWAAGVDVPEGGYRGAYVEDLARDLNATAQDDPHELGDRGVALIMSRAHAELEEFGVVFDRFQSERELHDSGIVQTAIEAIHSAGQVFEQDGAVFMRTTAFGDDKDRAIVRANGVPTYYAADIGYLMNKYDRGVDRVIHVLGSDHHGYVARLKAAAAALGHDADSCEVIIMQLVHLVEGGVKKRMSKRRGEFVLMSELIDSIGTDATRFYMVQRSHDQTIELDLDLAAEQSAKNPVYYVQYAHARICSIIAKAAESGFTPDPARFEDAVAGRDGLDVAERRLIKRIAEFPVIVEEAALRRAPHRLTVYAHDLAMDFALFYRDCRVIGDGIDEATTRYRLALCDVARWVLAVSLDLVGVSAPTSM